MSVTDVRRNKVLAMLVLLAVGMTAHAQSTGEAGAQIVNPPIPKGAVHLVVRNDAEAKKVFTYFPYPRYPDWYQPDFSNPHPPDIGVYRIEVTPEGTRTTLPRLRRPSRYRWAADASLNGKVRSTWTCTFLSRTSSSNCSRCVRES